MKRDYLKHLGFTTSVALLTANKSTMSRIAYCAACAAIENGVKSRIAFEHTCGLPASEWPVPPPRKTWKERLAEEQAKLGQAPTATEVANNLYELEKAHQAIDELKRWQEEAKRLLNPVWDFADDNLEVKPGKCKIAAVIEHAQKSTELIHEALVHIEYLENKFNIVTGSGNNLKSRLQTFLDGTK